MYTSVAISTGARGKGLAMETRIISEAGEALFAVHFWAGDTRNHRYARAQLEDSRRDTFLPDCTPDGFVIPARWAFRSELSQELGADRDRSRDCRTCFRRAR
ncbi:hypothetical protein VSH64_15090 [Amycolatopsis rhabdoformis]|uniref:Uncharacterized protein n=1 Tax=Amycolatopsis rhabdoformis TaxID=1448059 RepID=A0ABZ1IG47_9PSEU|nr:hypothetical protein [Amycolatopsis rhabdoformis]WSE33425.1 hypothetical protein VSH64_15090 [Amycolatopsis rhabdoformis]